MSGLSELWSTVDFVAGACRRRGIRFAITGGMAAIQYGDPRFTQDVDLVIDLSDVSKRRGLREELEPRFYVSGIDAQSMALTSDMVQAIEVSSSIKVDMYPRELVPGSLARARDIEVSPGRVLPFVRVEDSIVSKLIWIDLGSARSRRDVMAMLLHAPAIDAELLDRLASQCRMGALLAELRSEAQERTRDDKPLEGPG